MVEGKEFRKTETVLATQGILYMHRRHLCPYDHESIRQDIRHKRRRFTG